MAWIPENRKPEIDPREDNNYLLPEDGPDERISSLSKEQLVFMVGEMTSNLTSKELNMLIEETMKQIPGEEINDEENMIEGPEMGQMPEMSMEGM